MIYSDLYREIERLIFSSFRLCICVLEIEIKLRGEELNQHALTLVGGFM